MDARAPGSVGFIARADFTLSSAARHLDYRFWLNGMVRVMLERVDS